MPLGLLDLGHPVVTSCRRRSRSCWGAVCVLNWEKTRYSVLISWLCFRAKTMIMHGQACNLDLGAAEFINGPDWSSSKQVLSAINSGAFAYLFDQKQKSI